VPEPLNDCGVPRRVAPSLNWTEPVGVAVLIPAPAVLATFAVKVTDCPRIDGFTEEVTVVEVGAGLTVWPRFLELPLKFPSVFVYTALIVCGDPITVRVAVAPLVAFPEPESGTAAPNNTPSTENWTEPVGVAVLMPAPAVLATVAVKVTDCPKIDGFTEEVRVVEVGAGLTVWPRLPELPLKAPSVFVYTALMVCGEPLTFRVAVALLVAIAAVPDPESSTAAPNGTPSTENWTEPVGVAVVAPVLVTVAVKTTDCPKVDGFAEEATVVVVATQVGMADVVLDGTLSCGGLVFASTAVTKYEYVGPHVTFVSVNVSEVPGTEPIDTAVAPFVER
jgi:hypothetical protein